MQRNGRLFYASNDYFEWIRISLMHINKIDLNLFVVLDAVYTAGSVTGAAAQLNLSQPAVSHALGRLRELLGDPLFERQGRRMVPTPLARNIIAPVRRSLRGLELSVTEAQAFDPLQSRRRFVIGLRGVMESALLAPLARDLSRLAPRVSVATVRNERRLLENDLAAGQLDLALDVLLPVPPSLRHQRVLHDRLVVMLRADHPLLNASLDLGSYLGAGHVMVSARRSGAGIEDLALSEQGLERTVRLRCQEYYAACQVLIETDFLLTLPQIYAERVNRHFGHAMRPFPLSAPVMDAYLYWHANVHSDPANRWLRARVIQALAG